jgi:hypothetical protein
MEDKNFIFKFDNNEINFSLRGDGNGTMINATEMAKPFGKLFADWYRQKSTKEFLKALESDMGIPISQLVVVIKGNYGNGIKQGTWLHEDVALEFARWLNPIFAIWCNKRIKEIIINGYSVINSNRESFEKAYTGIQQKLIESNNEIIYLKNTLDTQKDLVNFANLVISTSENLYTMTEITKGLNLCKSSKDIYNILESKNIIFHQGNKWFLKAPYDTLGLTKDIMIAGKDGKPHNQRRWTEKGKYFIMSVSL